MDPHNTTYLVYSYGMLVAWTFTSMLCLDSIIKQEEFLPCTD